MAKGKVTFLTRRRIIGFIAALGVLCCGTVAIVVVGAYAIINSNNNPTATQPGERVGTIEVIPPDTPIQVIPTNTPGINPTSTIPKVVTSTVKRVSTSVVQHTATSPARNTATSKPALVQPTSQTCCKHCTTGKPCGDSCITKNKTCTKPPGCACP